MKKCDTANNSDEHVICNVPESVVVSDIDGSSSETSHSEDDEQHEPDRDCS